MDARTKRQTALLLVVLAVAAAALWLQLRPTAGIPPVASNGGRPAGEAPATGQDAPPALALGALEAEVPAPRNAGRNLFRFEQTAPPAASAMPPPAGAGPAPAQPPPRAPGPAAVPLQFIGLVEGAGDVGRIAVLTDGRVVHHGREGDIVDGRFRIVRIGAESIEIEPIDGRVRQIIRLSGS